MVLPKPSPRFAMSWPDLILLDIGFPPDVAHGGQMAWDGFQIMSWLHGFKEAGSIPFIIITGVDLAEYSQRSLAGIAAASFRKPINHKELLSGNQTPSWLRP